LTCRSGQQTVDVPAGAQPDTILRLVGKGLPSFGGGRPGWPLRAASGSRARAAHRPPARIVRAVEGDQPPQTKL